MTGLAMEWIFVVWSGIAMERYRKVRNSDGEALVSIEWQRKRKVQCGKATEVNSLARISKGIEKQVRDMRGKEI